MESAELSQVQVGHPIHKKSSKLSHIVLFSDSYLSTSLTNQYPYYYIHFGTQYCQQRILRLPYYASTPTYSCLIISLLSILSVDSAFTPQLHQLPPPCIFVYTPIADGKLDKTVSEKNSRSGAFESCDCRSEEPGRINVVLLVFILVMHSFVHSPTSTLI